MTAKKIAQIIIDRDKTHKAVTDVILMNMFNVTEAVQEIFGKNDEITWVNVSLTTDNKYILVEGIIELEVGAVVTLSNGAEVVVTEGNKELLERNIKVNITVEMAENADKETIKQFLKEHIMDASLESKVSSPPTDPSTFDYSAFDEAETNLLLLKEYMSSKGKLN